MLLQIKVAKNVKKLVHYERHSLFLLKHVTCIYSIKDYWNHNNLRSF